MKFEILAGRIAVGTAHAKNYTDWAEALLCEGCDSENIAILAGYGMEQTPDPDKIKFYFQRSLEDLGLELPLEKEGILLYAKCTCDQIINEEILPQDGLAVLEKITSLLSVKYDDTYYFMIWDVLGEDVWAVLHGGGNIWSEGLTPDNVDSYIMKVAVQFRTLFEMKLPLGFYYFAFCENCCYIGAVEWKVTEKPWLAERFFRAQYGERYRAGKTVCAQCGGDVLKHMWDYEARERYIEQHLSGKIEPS